MKIEFLAPAEQELLGIVEFYNSESEGLGFEFASEVKNTLERIIQYPHVWYALSKRTRRCRTNRFPYSVIYQQRPDTILVVAIMHMHQKPNSWKSRLTD